MNAPAIDPDRTAAFAGRLFGDATAALELATVYLGDRLGLYRALADHGPATAAELACAAGAHERYVREWVRAQAVCDIVEHDADGRYRLPPEHAEALLDRESLAYLTPLAGLLPLLAASLGDLLEAFRHGGGVPFERYGSQFPIAQQDLTRPLFVNGLGDWLAALPELDARLTAIDSPARAVDIGCGAGIACLELARRYPHAFVDGIDLDEASIDLARANARAAGFDGRVRFHVRDAADPGLEDAYDLVTMFDSLHHLAQPVPALRRIRSLLAPRGVAVIAEVRAEGDFERYVHLMSVVHCLPTAMADQPSAGLGAVVASETILELAAEAGFGHAELAPIEHDLLRFFALRR